MLAEAHEGLKKEAGRLSVQSELTSAKKGRGSCMVPSGVSIIHPYSFLKNGIGEGGDSWNSICGSIFPLWGRLDKWNWGPPIPFLLKVGGMCFKHSPVGHI